MKKTVLVSLALVGGALGLEIAARGLVPVSLTSADVWMDDGAVRRLRPDQEGARQGGLWRTDADGFRRDGARRASDDVGYRLLVLGGRYTAAEGLDEEELYTAELERQIREHSSQRDAVVVASVLQGPVQERLDRWLELVDRLRPQAVLWQVEASLPERVTPFVFEPEAAVAEDDPGGGLALGRAVRWRPLRRERERGEASARASLQRDGVSARATRHARERTHEILTTPTERLDPQARELLDELLRERFSAQRLEAQEATSRATTAFLDALKRRGCVVAMLRIGPPVLTAVEAQAAALQQLPVRYGVPVFLDPALRVAGRPAACTHAATGRALYAWLADEGYFGVGAEVPERQRVEASLIDGVLTRYMGQQNDLAREARDRIQPHLDFQRDAEPFGLLGGLGPHGQFRAGEVAEVVAWPGFTVDSELDVVVRVPSDGTVPELEICWVGVDRDRAAPASQQKDGAHLVLTYTFPESTAKFRDSHKPLQIFPPAGVPADRVQLLRMTFREL